ncbi:MAG: COP23 domain-containing protein [Oculatellaceae cyanobacterium Prado106]|jgi:uncharacterized protein YndB with AHSA1/START domain|nr:COP23 domain-containing protein [Oculatellaceae cyanobacterium Prado106]
MAPHTPVKLQKQMLQEKVSSKHRFSAVSVMNSVFKKMGLTGGAIALLASGSILPASAVPAISQMPPNRSEPAARPTTSPSRTPESTSAPAQSGTQQARNVRFSCQMMDGEYTVVYNPSSQPDRVFPWAKPSEMGGGWTPERRCAEISRRLEEYRPDGLLEMQSAVENGYNTLCVTTEAVSTCRIVLTVPEGEDPLVIRDRVFGNLTTADSGQQTTAVNTFTGNDNEIVNQIGSAIGVDLSSLGSSSSRRSRSSSINLRPFLDRADGGTGTRLR